MHLKALNLYAFLPDISSVNKSTPATKMAYVTKISLPFKDQKSADAVRKQLKDLSKKIETELQQVCTSPIGDKLKLQEEKPALVNHQCVVYIFNCDLCDADYIGYTTRHPLLLAST